MRKSISWGWEHSRVRECKVHRSLASHPDLVVQQTKRLPSLPDALNQERLVFIWRNNFWAAAISHLLWIKITNDQQPTT